MRKGSITVLPSTHRGEISEKLYVLGIFLSKFIATSDRKYFGYGKNFSASLSFSKLFIEIQLFVERNFCYALIIFVKEKIWFNYIIFMI